jgi:hypothetical protein
MNFTEKDSQNSISLPSDSRSGSGNYYAFFDRPVPENLAANRHGILMPQQRSAIEQRIAYHKNSASLIVGMIVCVALSNFFLFWMVDKDDGVLSFANLIVSGSIVIVLLLMLAGMLIDDLFLLFTRDDFEGDGVESAIGKVEWVGKRYRAHTDSRQLRSFRSGVALPPPGNYRFYYLPRSGLIVMAEEIKESSGEEFASVLLQILARANRFSLEDLSQNHQGRLSKHQQNRLAATLALYVFVVLGGAILGVSVIPQMPGEDPSGLFLPLLVFAVFIVLRLGLSVAQLIGDLWNGAVSSVEGSVIRQTRRSRYYRSYYYVVGSHRFQVSEAASNALIEGMVHRIYYAPRSKRLMSIEPL